MIGLGNELLDTVDSANPTNALHGDMIPSSYNHLGDARKLRELSTPELLKGDQCATTWLSSNKITEVTQELNSSKHALQKAEI